MTPNLCRAARGLLAAGLVMALPPALAERPGPALWGYADAHGTVHLAATRIDARYQLIASGGAVDGRAPRVPGKADDAARLLTRIDIDPAARALRPLLRQAAQAHGVDESLLMALIAVESGFDPRAVSPRGAVGLMQIMPVAGERYAPGATTARPMTERLLDPRTNIDVGARMLADLLRRFGRIELALAAWNAGEGAVRRAGAALPPYAETRAHVLFVLELYWSMLQEAQMRRATRLAVAPG